MPGSATKAIELADVLYGYLMGLDESGLAPFLAAWPSKPFKNRMVFQSTLPVLSYLPDLVEDTDSETKRLVKMFKTMAVYLPWGQTYAAEDLGTAFLEKYGWTELIGLRGPIKSKDIACGFLMLGPDIEYPGHSHEAEEVYVPLSSHALWRQGNDPWVLRPNGIPIYHRSWLIHGVRTGSSALLALYLWRKGDLAQKSHIL